MAARSDRDGIGDLVGAVFEELQQARRVDVRVQTGRIDVVPALVNASPVSVVDSAPQIDVVVGGAPFVAVHELWSEDRHSNLDRLRELLEAIRDGRHERTVETLKRDRVRIIDRFELLSGPAEYDHSTTASSPVETGEKMTERLQAY
ncbi:MAG TPA: hypothetical protein VH063_02745 [Gaiellaceae bacterium]|jgi:hypothetical protein|nr:hypothetical protein [Gaiellaceae bacterium]